MNEAKRLNMLDGHFFWLWIDASKEHNVYFKSSNRTHFLQDSDINYERSKIKHREGHQYNEKRKKRYMDDNNSTENANLPNTLRKFSQVSKENIIKENNFFVKNKSKTSIFRRVSRNISKFETHINNKTLYINFTQSFESSRNISSESVENYNVNNKGVETSKVKNNLSEKENMSFLDKNKSRQTNSSKLKNESFNKYVNSISVNGMYNTENVLLQEKIISSYENIKNLKDSELFSSDISEFMVNPTVHTSKLNSVKEQIEGKKYLMMDQVIDEPLIEINDNITEILNSLPVGLLTLHPEPMKIGK